MSEGATVKQKGVMKPSGYATDVIEPEALISDMGAGFLKGFLSMARERAFNPSPGEPVFTMEFDVLVGASPGGGPRGKV